MIVGESGLEGGGEGAAGEGIRVRTKSHGTKLMFGSVTLEFQTIWRDFSIELEFEHVGF